MCLGVESSDPLNLKMCLPGPQKYICKIMAFMAIIKGLGLLFYILLGLRVYCTMLSEYFN